MAITITGTNAVQQRIRAAALKAGVVARAAVQIEAELIKTEAMRRTPVQYGALKASARVLMRKTEAVIHFGGGGGAGLFGDQQVDYAAAVHERTWITHRNGEAKYLENAVTMAMPGFAGRVAARTKAALGS